MKTILALLLCAVCLLVAETSPAAEPTDNLLMGLKKAPGRELVIANCIPCHSTATISANHLSRKQWDKMITQMRTQNGMWPIQDGMRLRILDYLEATQRPADPGLDAGKTTAWATPLYRPNPLWPGVPPAGSALNLLLND